MSATIDERIVEMKFDNSDFEKNVATSMSTLDKLKEALKFTKSKESLQTLNKAVENVALDKMADSIQAIENRFSTMGIAGMVVIQRLTNAALDLSKKIFTAIPSQIAHGGWKRALNVEQAKFQLEGLGIAWEEVSADIDHAVQDTAYGADEAAKAASSLAASGVNFRNATKDASGNIEVYSDMGRALRAISGVAAMTNSEYSDIAQIFTKVAGNGRLMGDELNRLAAKGLNVAATMGQSMGKSESEVREMVSKGKVSFQMFADAMDEAFGEHATKANDTLQGSMANMKAALSRIGQDFAQTIMQQTPQIFNSLKGFFNKLRNFTKPFADNIFTPTFTRSAKIISKIIDNATASIRTYDKNVNSAIYNVTDHARMLNNFLSGMTNLFSNLLLAIIPISRAFKEVFNGRILDKIYDFSKGFNAFTNNLVMSDSASESLQKIFKLIFTIIKSGFDVLMNVLHVLSPLLKIVTSIGSVLLKVAGIISEFIANVILAVTNSKTFNAIFESMYKVVNTVCNIISKLVGYFGDLAAALANSMLVKAAELATKCGEAFAAWAKKVDLANKAFKVFAIALLIPVGLIAGLVYGIYTLVDAISKLQIVKDIGAILKVTLGNMGSFIKDMALVVTAGVLKIVEALKTLSLSELITGIKNKFTSVLETIRSFFTKLSGGTEKLTRFKEQFSSLIEALKKFKDAIANGGITDAFTKPLVNAGEATYSFKDLLTGIIEKIKAFTAALDLNKVIVLVYTLSMISLMRAVSNGIKSFSKLTKSVTGTFDAITGFFKGITTKQKSKIKEMSECILMLSFALAILASLPREDLLNATYVMLTVAAALLTFSAIMAGIAKVIKTLDIEKELNQMIRSFMALSLTMVVMAGAIKILDSVKVSWDLVAALGLMMAAVTILVGIAAIAGRLNAKTTLKSILVMTSLSIALLSIAGALKIIAGVNWDTLSDNLEVVIAVMGVLAVIAVMASHMGLFSAVGLIAFVLVLKNLIPSFEEIARASSFMQELLRTLDMYRETVIAIGVIAVAMTAAASFFGKGFRKFGAGMLMIAASFIILQKGMVALSTMDPTDVVKAMAVVAKVYLLFGMLGLILSIGHGGQHAIKIAVAIGALTICLYAISGAVFIMGTMNPAKVDQGIKAIAGIMAAFALVIAAASAGSNGKGALGVMLSLVFGLVAIISELIVLTFVPYDDLIHSTIAICALMLSFGATMNAILASIHSETHGMAILGTMGVMVMMAVELLAIGATLYAVSRFDWEDILSSGVAIRHVMAGIGKLVKTIAKIKDGLDIKAFGTVLVFSLILIPIAKALQMVSGFEWTSILAAGKAIDGTLNHFGKLIKTVNDMDKFDIDKAMALVVASATVVVIGLAFREVGDIPWGQLLGSALAIDLVILALGGIIKKISKTENFDMKKAQALIVASGSIIAIGVGLAIASKNPWDRVLPAMLAIDGVLVAFGIVITTMSKIPANLGTFGNVLAAILLLGAIVGALWAVNAINEHYGGELLAAVQSLTEVLISLTVAVGVCALLGAGAIIGALAGIAGIAIFITGFIFIIDMIGKFFASLEKEKYQQMIEGCAKLTQLGALIGNALGEFIGNIAEGFTKHLPAIAESLSDFVQKMQPFANGLKSFNMESLTGAVYLSGILAVLAGGEFLQGIVTLLTGNDMSKTAKGLVELGEGISGFAAATSSIQGENFAAIGEATLAIVKAIGEMAIGNILDRITSIFTGSTNMASLKSNLEGFGEAIIAFANEVSGLEPSAVEGGIAAGEMIAGLLKVLPNQGGLIGALVGNNNIEFFTEERMQQFGKGLYAFYWATKNLEKGCIDGAIDVAEQLFALKPPNEGGALGFILGDNTFDKFNPERLDKFGKGLQAFKNAVTGIKAGSVDGAIDVATKIFSLDPPNEGGLLFVMVGDNTYDKMGEELPKFGDGVKKFCDSINGITEGHVKCAKNAIEIMQALFEADFAALFSQIIGVNIQTTLDDTEKFKEGLMAIGNGLISFNDATSSLNLYRMDAIMKVIEDLGKMFETVGNVKSGSLKNFTDAMRNCGDMGIQAFIDAFNSVETHTKVDNGVVAFTLYVAGSITDHRKNMDASISGLVTYIANKFGDPTYKGTFETAANNLMEGFINGIQNAEKTATTSAKSVVNATANAMIARAQEVKPQVYKAGFDLADTGGFTDAVQDVANTEAERQARGLVDTVKDTVIDESNDVKAAVYAKGQEIGAEFGKGAGNGIKYTIAQIQEAIAGVMTGKISLGSLKDMVANFAGDVSVGSPLYASLTAIEKQFELADGTLTNLAGTMLDATKNGGDLAASIDGAGKAAGKAKDKFKEFKESLESTLESKTGGMNFFNKLELKTETTAASILENMRSNIDGVASWTARLAQVAEKGLDQGLIKVLAEAGVDSYDQVSAFLQMTDEQIREANEMYKLQAAGRAYAVNTIGDSYLQAGKNIAKGLEDGVNAGADAAVKSIVNISERGDEETCAYNQISSPSRLYRSYGMYIDLGLMNGISSYASRVTSVVAALCRQIKYYFEDGLRYDWFKEIGLNIGRGLAEGIEESGQKAINKAEEIATKVCEIMANVPQVESPSKVTRWIGNMIGLGLEKGLDDSSKSVEGSAYGMADSVLTPLQAAIKDASSYVSNHMDLNPTITPMLDLSPLMDQVSSIDSLFADKEMAVASGSRRTGTGSTFTSDNGAVVDGNGNTNYIFNQNNYSPKALSRLDIYRDSRNLFSSMKGAVQGT